MDLCLLTGVNELLNDREQKGRTGREGQGVTGWKESAGGGQLRTEKVARTAAEAMLHLIPTNPSPTWDFSVLHQMSVLSQMSVDIYGLSG